MKLVHKALAFVSLALLAFIISCSHPTTLQSIDVTPANPTVSGASLADLVGFTEKFTALGHFIHPFKTVDITDRVTWAVNPPSFAVVDQHGNVTLTGGGCGDILVTATAHRDVIGSGDSNAVIVGEATLTANVTGNATCGSQQPLLISVTNGGGTVSAAVNGVPTTISGCSNTGGLSCLANVNTGSTVTLTSTAPATFTPNCSPLGVTGTQCTIIVNNGAKVGVTF